MAGVHSGAEHSVRSHDLSNPLIEASTTPAAPAVPYAVPRSEYYTAPNNMTNPVNHSAPQQNYDTPPRLSNCYIFKSRLQEYAQKVGHPTPVYETIKEGPSHEPTFRSTVIVNNIRYDSLPGFFNRKAAEQSAAEVALVELAKSGEPNECIHQEVHETGLCKNLLQEYAQKMNYAIPFYECRKCETTAGRKSSYSCSVDIGGIKYIGAAARTKKEAEIKAARTALWAIQSFGTNGNSDGKSMFTVIPSKKKITETISHSQGESATGLKPKKSRFKRKQRRKKKASSGDTSKNRSEGENPVEGSEQNGNFGTQTAEIMKTEGSFDADSMAEVVNGSVLPQSEVPTEAVLTEVKKEAVLTEVKTEAVLTEAQSEVPTEPVLTDVKREVMTGGFYGSFGWM